MVTDHYVTDNWENGFLPCICGKNFQTLDDFVMHLKYKKDVESEPLTQMVSIESVPRQLTSMIGAITAKRNRIKIAGVH